MSCALSRPRLKGCHHAESLLRPLEYIPILCRGPADKELQISVDNYYVDKDCDLIACLAFGVAFRPRYGDNTLKLREIEFNLSMYGNLA